MLRNVFFLTYCHDWILFSEKRKCNFGFKNVCNGVLFCDAVSHLFACNHSGAKMLHRRGAENPEWKIFIVCLREANYKRALPFGPRV
jgi:hypothetical protein